MTPTEQLQRIGAQFADICERVSRKLRVFEHDPDLPTLEQLGHNLDACLKHFTYDIDDIDAYERTHGKNLDTIALRAQVLDATESCRAVRMQVSAAVEARLS